LIVFPSALAFLSAFWTFFDISLAISLVLRADCFTSVFGGAGSLLVSWPAVWGLVVAGVVVVAGAVTLGAGVVAGAVVVTGALAVGLELVALVVLAVSVVPQPLTPTASATSGQLARRSDLIMAKGY
jgi:hypothetical protein